MDSNTHSTEVATLTALVAAVDGLAAQDLNRLTDAVLAEQVVVLRGWWTGWKANAAGGGRRSGRCRG